MRFLAVLLSVVLLLTLATPAKAEAFDAMTALAIVGAAVLVVVLVVYLVVANVEGSKTTQADEDGARIVQDGNLVLVSVVSPRQSP